MVGFNRTSQAHRTGQQSGDSPAAHTSHALLAAALEASRALERQYAEVAEARQALSAALDEEKVGWEWCFLAKRGGAEERCAVAGMPTSVWCIPCSPMTCLPMRRCSVATLARPRQERSTKLEDELTHLTGQQNLNQRIQVRDGEASGLE